MATTTAGAAAPSRRGAKSQGPRRHLGKLVAAVALVALVALMISSTTFRNPSEEGVGGSEKFDAATYAEENYESIIVPWIKENAVPAQELAEAIQADVDAAGEAYGGRPGATNAWSFPVTFTGVAGEVNPGNGMLPVTVEGMPEGIEIFVQTGPVVNGSALRDVTGKISFGMFTNQIEFQSVGFQLNEKAKELVLADIDAAALNGQTISVTGAFSAGNPAAWIVTPVELEVAE